MVIAFCFLISFTFPMEKVWERFFKNAKNFLIVVHAKPSFKFQTSFFCNKAVLLNPIDTSWGNISLVKAQNLMLKYACFEENADFCCILSGNCIPIKTFSYMENNLEDVPLSRFFLTPSYNPLFLKKQSQWCILSLEHIQVILKYAESYYEFFEKNNLSNVNPFGAPDEYFYVNLLMSKNIDNFLHTGSTYCKWNKIHNGHPKSFHKISRNKIMKLEKSHYFFMRKIMTNCVIVDAEETSSLKENYYPTKKPVYIEMQNMIQLI